WSGFARGADLWVRGLAALRNGDLIAGGSFSAIGGRAAKRIARWDGSEWAPLGQGVTSTSGSTVRAIVETPTGDVIAGGEFLAMGGIAANHVARWDGANWSALGSGVSGGTSHVYALAALDNGDVIVGGLFTAAGGVAGTAAIARWDGASWSSIGGVGVSGRVYALAKLPGGDLVAGGWFASAGGTTAASIARWNGSTWSAFGGGIAGAVYAIAILPNGDLIAAGDFTMAGGAPAANIARWDGATWSALGAGTDLTIRALTVLPNGDVLAGGAFTLAGGVACNRVARWDGSAWSPIETGMDRDVYGLTTTGDGSVFAGGDFLVAGGRAASYVTKLETSCPAIVTSSGGCPSSGGNNLLVASAAPWIGSTLRTAASGLPQLAVTFAITGLAVQSLPLAALTPLAPPGCVLLVSTDAVEFVPTGNGAASWQLAVPNSVTFAGVVLRHQMVPSELDAFGNLVEVTATNALVLTIGAY
ncbi:MAG: hypothetical protein KDE27_18630, partial [Planctomycetes bacterium]|nr:hypothetical protein [Planctomycetota bacterium]